MRIFYTDGSFGADNIKAGGWAYLELAHGKIVSERCAADFSIDVTINQMEMKAAIEALKMVKSGESATIYSDSQYLTKGITEWIVNWQKNNWKTSKKEAVSNKELWLEISEQAKGKKIKWIWIRGHSNNEFNDRVDILSKLIYTKPETIQMIKVEKKNPIMLDVGTMFYFLDPSKKYVVILNEVSVNNSRGFLARLFANNLGNELDFFEYDSDINVVEEKSDKEAAIVFNTIKQFKDNVADVYHLLKRSCKHKINKSGDSAVCSSCGVDFGWYCPKSKDKSCHYSSDNGKVRLNTGQLVNVPEDHDCDYETYDSCIFCGDPQERQ